MILIKDQEKSKGNKKGIHIRKSRCVKSDRTCCYIRKFNVALSLCKVLGVTFYFSENFLEVATGGLAVAEVPQPLGVTIVTN